MCAAVLDKINYCPNDLLLEFQLNKKNKKFANNLINAKRVVDSHTQFCQVEVRKGLLSCVGHDRGQGSMTGQFFALSLSIQQRERDVARAQLVAAAAAVGQPKTRDDPLTHIDSLK